MIPTQTMTDFPEFSNNGTKTKPDNTKYAAGFAEADQLPYEWLNWFLNRSSKGISGLNAGLYSVEQELNNVLAAANIQPAQATANQLLTALNYLIQAKTGALADLTTTEKDTLVAAINELNENKSPKAGSAELTTCAKGVFGDAAAHGVDTEITEGSSNLPTSDAVNSSLAELAENRSYSTEEHWTGKYWYDGKKIYEKTINGNYATLGSVLANLSILNVSDFVSEKHLIQFNANSASYYSNGDIVANNTETKPPYTYMIGNNVLTLVILTSSFNENKVKFISLEYTKTTD